MNKIFFIILVIGIIYIFKKHHANKYIILKDYMEGKEGELETEDKPFNSDYKKAWTEENVTKNTKYYTSDIQDEKTDPGMFFDKNNEYVDTTSYKSKDIIPDKCYYENDELKCKFNDRLQIIPPRLIENPEKNQVLLNIGNDKNINTNILSDEIFTFNGNSYNVWEYGNEPPKTYINDSTPLKIDSMKKNYAL